MSDIEMDESEHLPSAVDDSTLAMVRLFYREQPEVGDKLLIYPQPERRLKRIVETINRYWYAHRARLGRYFRVYARPAPNRGILGGAYYSVNFMEQDEAQQEVEGN